jgi:hypothetical protein
MPSFGREVKLFDPCLSKNPKMYRESRKFSDISRPLPFLANRGIWCRLTYSASADYGRNWRRTKDLIAQGLGANGVYQSKGFSSRGTFRSQDYNPRNRYKKSCVLLSYWIKFHNIVNEFGSVHSTNILYPVILAGDDFFKSSFLVLVGCRDLVHDQESCLFC